VEEILPIKLVNENKDIVDTNGEYKERNNFGNDESCLDANKGEETD
jgi:hypothetical protein